MFPEKGPEPFSCVYGAWGFCVGGAAPTLSALVISRPVDPRGNPLDPLDLTFLLFFDLIVSLDIAPFEAFFYPVRISF